jgi:hypothetical protein
MTVHHTHAQTPLGQVPPVLAMVRKPVRTLLAGEELAAHQRELERVKRLKEENAQRKRREEELAAVSAHPTISLSLFLVQSSTAARCKMPFIRLITHCLLYSTLLCSALHSWPEEGLMMERSRMKTTMMMTIARQKRVLHPLQVSPSHFTPSVRHCVRSRIDPGDCTE